MTMIRFAKRVHFHRPIVRRKLYVWTYNNSSLNSASYTEKVVFGAYFWHFYPIQKVFHTNAICDFCDKIHIRLFINYNWLNTITKMSLNLITHIYDYGSIICRLSSWEFVILSTPRVNFFQWWLHFCRNVIKFADHLYNRLCCLPLISSD